MGHAQIRVSLLLVASLLLAACSLAPPAPVDEPASCRFRR